MKNDILIKLRIVMLFLLPVLFLLSSVLTGLFLCGVIENYDITYMCFSLSMLLNSLGIILNVSVKREDVEKALPKALTGKGFMVFNLVPAVIWLISYVVFIFLK